MNFAQGDVLTLARFWAIRFTQCSNCPSRGRDPDHGVRRRVGLGLEHFVIRKLQNKNVLAIYVVLATIAVSYILQNTIQAIWSTKMLNYPPVFGVSSLRIFGVKIQTESVFCIASSFLCMVGLHLFMKHTLSAFGTSQRAAAIGHQGRAGLRRQHIAEHGVTWAIAAAWRPGGILRADLRRVHHAGLDHRPQGLCGRHHGRLRETCTAPSWAASSWPHRNADGQLPVLVYKT
jgi:branched-chain amino acid transport system permease protein